MKRLLLIAAVLAATLAGCQKKELSESAASVQEGDGSISFSSYNQKTKASVATLDTLKKNSFGVFGMENQPDAEDNPTIWNPMLWADFFEANQAGRAEKVEWNVVSGAWKYSPVKYWSDNDKITMDFFAFSPYDSSVTYIPADNEQGSAMVGPFFINHDINEQKDILLATKFELPQVPKVVLEYQHALSRIGFSAYAPTLDGSDPSYSIQIVKVQLRAAADSGEKMTPTPFFSDAGYIMFKNVELTSGEMDRSPKWDFDTDPEHLYSITLDSTCFENEGVITNVPARLNLPDKYAMVIPQSNMSGMGIYVKYAVTRGGDTTYKDQVFQCPVTEFKVNTAYTFNFKLGVSEVAFDCTVKDWDEEVYSLNASGEVYAQSSREDCGVYVDAQRKGSGTSVSTTYNLYAEMKTVKEDNDSVNMFPIWKVTNRFYEGGGIEYGDLINIYLGWEELEGVKLNESYIGDQKYTVLSFVLNKDNKDQLAGNYYAEYIEDPIKAYIYTEGSSIKNSVYVSREYTASEHITDPDWYLYPYVSTVTLTPTSSLTSQPFNTWQVSYDGGATFIDYKEATDREYVLGRGATLTFEEDNVIYPTYSTTKYIYRAVYGSLTDQIGMFIGEDVYCALPKGGMAYETEEQAKFYDPGTEVELYSKIPDGASIEFRYYENRTTETYKRIVTDETYTVTELPGKVVVNFALSKIHSGAVIRSVVSGGEVTTSLSSTTATGGTLSDGMKLALTPTVEWDAEKSANVLVYSVPLKDASLPYISSTSPFFIFGNNSSYSKQKWFTLDEACKNSQSIEVSEDSTIMTVHIPILTGVLNVDPPYKLMVNDSLDVWKAEDNSAAIRINMGSADYANFNWVDTLAKDTNTFKATTEIIRMRPKSCIKIIRGPEAKAIWSSYLIDYTKIDAADTLSISHGAASIAPGHLSEVAITWK